MDDKKKEMDFELYKIAIQTRNLELGFFWQRSNYFLVLNTALATGSILTLEKIQNMFIFISIFGLLTSIIWILINLGSKFWQTRWEMKACELEKLVNIDVQLFSVDKETVKNDVKKFLEKDNHNFPRCVFDCLILTKPSVSMQMLYLSILFLIFYVVVIIFSCNNFCHY